MYTEGAYTDRFSMERFPYHGVFYVLATTASDDGSYNLDEDDDDDTVSEDGSYSLDEDEDDETSSDSTSSDSSTGTETDDDASNTDDTSDSTSSDSAMTIILETPCDIQSSNATFNGQITRGYRVFFPFNPETATLPAELKPGILFRGEAHGLTIAGTVLDPAVSMLGGCVVDIRGTDI